MKRYLKYLSICLVAALLFVPSVSAFSLNTKFRGSTKLGKDFSDLYGTHGLESNLMILIHQNMTASTLTDDSGNSYGFYQGTAANQGAVTTGPPPYIALDTDEYYPLQEIDSEQGALSYTTEGADSTFTDASQVFTAWQTTTGTAAYRIVVHNDDATISYGYLGAAVSATEIKVYQDIALTTSGWLGTAIAGKTPSTYEVYKVIGSDNLTGDQTHILLIKPDDGRPASTAAIVGANNNVAGQKAFTFHHLAAGNFRLYASEDGTNFESVTTSAPPLADGAQASFSFIGAVLDKTSGTGAIYVNGSSVGISEDITTGTVFDGPHPLEIGAQNGTNYYNGQIALYMCFNTALTATQILNIYNSDAVQAIINM